MGRHPSDARDRILRAATETVVEHGVGALTIDAVAGKAQLSKGGVLHHFPTKDALIEGMIASAFAEQDDALVAFMVDDKGPEAGRFLRAWIRLAERPWSDALGQAFLAAVVQNPELLGPVKRRYEDWYTRGMNDGIPVPDAIVIMSAVDSSVTVDSLFGTRMPAELEHMMLERLREMASPAKPNKQDPRPGASPKTKAQPKPRSKPKRKAD